MSVIVTVLLYLLLVLMSRHSVRVRRWRRNFEFAVFLDIGIVATYDIVLAAWIQLRQCLLPKDPFYLTSAILAYLAFVLSCRDILIGGKRGGDDRRGTVPVLSWDSSETSCCGSALWPFVR